MLHLDNAPNLMNLVTMGNSEALLRIALDKTLRYENSYRLGAAESLLYFVNDEKAPDILAALISGIANEQLCFTALAQPSAPTDDFEPISDEDRQSLGQFVLNLGSIVKLFQQLHAYGTKVDGLRGLANAWKSEITSVEAVVDYLIALTRTEL